MYQKNSGNVTILFTHTYHLLENILPFNAGAYYSYLPEVLLIILWIIKNIFNLFYENHSSVFII